jgi:hypothetical protein
MRKASEDVPEGEELQVKSEWIKLKKKQGSLIEMHPLTLTIDTISNLPDSTKIISDQE